MPENIKILIQQRNTRSHTMAIATARIQCRNTRPTARNTHGEHSRPCTRTARHACCGGSPLRPQQPWYFLLSCMVLTSTAALVCPTKDPPHEAHTTPQHNAPPSQQLQAWAVLRTGRLHAALRRHVADPARPWTCRTARPSRRCRAEQRQHPREALPAQAPAAMFAR